MRLLFVLVLVFGLAGGVACDSRPAGQSESAATATTSSSTAVVANPASGTSNAAATSTSCDPTMAQVCQGSCATKMAYQESDIVLQPGARQGDLTRCVVSGVVFKVGEGNPKVAHAGNDYILCCQGCAGKFNESPGRYVKS